MSASARDHEPRIIRLDVPEVLVFGRTIVELREGIDAPCLWCDDASDPCGMCFRTGSEPSR
jgi:hypothetical protein